MSAAKPCAFRYWNPEACILGGVGPDSWTLFGVRDGVPYLEASSAVIDDFGTLVSVEDQFEARRHFWAEMPSLDDAADLYGDALHTRRRAERAAEHEAERTRALLTPQPLTAELSEEDEWGETQLTVGRDDRFLETRCVRLNVLGSEAPVLLTHAQLRAIAMAADVLLNAPRRERKPRVVS